MFVQVKRNETWEEGNWNNFELFSSLELIVLEWRIDQMAGTTWRVRTILKSKIKVHKNDWNDQSSRETKRLSWFWSKNWIFFHFLFWGKMILKKCLGIIYIEKNRLYPIKICTSDSRIFAYFPKGLTHDFSQKIDSRPSTLRPTVGLRFAFWHVQQAFWARVNQRVCHSYKRKENNFEWESCWTFGGLLCFIKIQTLHLSFINH